MNIPKGEGIEKEEGCFRVMTWNVNGPVDDEDGTVKKGILEEIERSEPDILCFQESYHKPSGRCRCHWIASLAIPIVWQ